MERAARFAAGFAAGFADSVVTTAVSTANAMRPCVTATEFLDCAAMGVTLADEALKAYANPRKTASDIANSAAGTIGSLREDLVSGDGFRAGGAAAEVTMAVASVLPAGALSRTASAADTAQAAVAAAVARAEAKGQAYYMNLLTNKQFAAGTQYPNLMKAGLGQRFHQEVARQLAGQMQYLTRGPDLLAPSGVRVELTTPGDLARHIAKPGYGPPSDLLRYVTYLLP